MIKPFHVLSLILVLVLTFCSQRKTKERVVNPTWTKRSLPNGWIIYLPPYFIDSTFQGIDSQPGYISSNKDSILLKYNSGSRELLLKGKLNDDDCDFSKQVAIAKSQIENDETDYFGKENKIYNRIIDTLDGRVAIISTPIKKGEHQVGMSIKDCKSGKWLSIYGEDLSKTKEELVLEIFRTIRFEKK